MEINKVSVIGLGYIGLPTAAMFASVGIPVIGIDNNPDVVATINQGEIHIVEPGLNQHVANAVKTGLLRASTSPEPADAFLIAVPTPFKDGNKPDTSYIKNAVNALSPVLKPGDIVILESTSPVGTTEAIATWISQNRPDLTVGSDDSMDADILIAHCPERVLPGNVMHELVHNDRVIGGLNYQSSLKAQEIYKTFVQANCIITNARTAEMAKLTENSFRDVNIAFANELSMICDNLDINVWELISLANRHPRVNILQPGPGVGGHCIAVDPWFIVDSDPEQSRLIKTARIVNDLKPEKVLQKTLTEAKKHSAPKIACFGISFKADIDDLRESPALDIVNALAENKNFEILVIENNIKELPNSLSQQSNVSHVSIDYALKNGDIVLGLVDHQEFKSIDRKLLEGCTVIDTRGMWIDRRKDPTRQKLRTPFTETSRAQLTIQSI